MWYGSFIPVDFVDVSMHLDGMSSLIFLWFFVGDLHFNRMEIIWFYRRGVYCLKTFFKLNFLSFPKFFRTKVVYRVNARSVCFNIFLNTSASILLSLYDGLSLYTLYISLLYHLSHSLRFKLCPRLVAWVKMKVSKIREPYTHV